MDRSAHRFILTLATPAPAELIAARHVLGTRSTTPPHVTALCVVDASKTGFIFTVASGLLPVLGLSWLMYGRHPRCYKKRSWKNAVCRFCGFCRFFFQKFANCQLIRAAPPPPLNNFVRLWTKRQKETRKTCKTCTKTCKTFTPKQKNHQTQHVFDGFFLI